MIEDITKKCTKCSITKSLDYFSIKKPHQKYKYNRSSVCKTCTNGYERNRIMTVPEFKAGKYKSNTEYRKRNPDKYRGTFRTKYYLKNIGIEFSEDDYNNMLILQNGVCKICSQKEFRNGKEIRLSIDHCHKTNVVRGLLCGNCNRAIGLLKDDSDLLIIAANYLKENG